MPHDRTLDDSNGTRMATRRKRRGRLVSERKVVDGLKHHHLAPPVASLLAAARLKTSDTWKDTEGRRYIYEAKKLAAPIERLGWETGNDREQLYFVVPASMHNDEFGLPLQSNVPLVDDIVTVMGTGKKWVVTQSTGGGAKPRERRTGAVLLRKLT